MKKPKTIKQDEEIVVLLNRMSNWQRNQWARAGYPQDIKVMEAFADKKHGGGAA